MATDPWAKYENPKDIGEWFYNYEAEQKDRSRTAFYAAMEQLIDEAYSDIKKDLRKTRAKTSKSSKTKEK